MIEIIIGDAEAQAALERRRSAEAIQRAEVLEHDLELADVEITVLLARIDDLSGFSEGGHARP
jgi:hypothetical protein